MKQQRLILAIRLILTFCLGYAVYKEAGGFTAFSLLLVFASIELSARRGKQSTH